MTRAPSRRVAMAMVVALAAPAAAVEDGPAPPRPSLSSEQIGALMHSYYEGEKLTVIPFSVAGVAGIVAGSVLVSGPGDVAHGAGWPLLTLGAVELVAGVLFSLQGVAHRRALDRLLVADPGELARREREHIYRIRDRFQPVLLAFEGAVAVAGGVMAGVGAQRGDGTVEGVGLGLLIEGIVLFVLDWTVLDRARPYAAGLALFDP